MKTCCFCWNLRSGTIATGVFILVTRTLAVILSTIILALRDGRRLEDFYSLDRREVDIPWYMEVNFDNTQLIISIADALLNLLFSALLLIGVRKKNKNLLLPWVVLATIGAIFGIIGFVVIIATTYPSEGVPKAIPLVIGVFLQIYMICCVFGYYKELKAGSVNAAYNAIPLNTPTVPEHVANTKPPLYSNTAGGYPQTSFYPTQPPPQYNVNPNPVYYGDPSHEKKPI